MATSSSGGAVMVHPLCFSQSRLMDFSFTSRNRSSKVSLLTRVKPSFCVRCVSSEPKQRVREPVTEEGVLSDLSTFPPDAASIASSIKYHAEFTPLFSSNNFEPSKAFFATAQSGRALLNAIGNLELTGEYADALEKLGHTLETVASQEPDAALGNGGLGRLASCFLDSLATLNYPAWGYGLRYKYGLFKQHLTKDGQEEVAENWLEIGNPWEIVRNDVSYTVKFYGKVVMSSDGKSRWIGGEDIVAVAYDVPIPGYKTKTTINLRLWSTKVPSDQFDLSAFNAGEHSKACEAQTNAEKICYILYPGDESEEGKILRLKQQYTLCSASLQDIIARFERRSDGSVRWEEFPDKVAVQMNDTHPTLCIPELMRILMDVKGLTWSEAWKITERTVAYTNHTVLPEALEKWSYELMQRLLPRHVEIIEMIDKQLIEDIISEYGTSNPEMLEKKLVSMRILENFDLPASVAGLFANPEENPIDDKTGEKVEATDADTVTDKEESEGEEKSKNEAANKEPAITPPKMVRMANLCVVAGHSVNGVAEIHSEIVKKDVFNDFFQLWPEKFQNKTNGVTPRRWIHFCNPDLSALITKWTSSNDWILKTEKLSELQKFADNEDLHNEWRATKRINKIKVASFLKEKTGYSVNPDAMFDIQVKRIHEYKRQLLNILGIVYRYKKMKDMNAAERKANFVPRVCIFGGKAFSTYVQAKRIIKFITDVGATINHDPDIGDLLKVIFVPDYNVTVAELLIPASELSQHISTAGMEASGTSNMKFSMNGCILIGTLDGANVEIRQEVGEDNFFLFGARAEDIASLRKERAEGKFVPDERFEEVKKFVKSGVFGPHNYDELMGSLEGNEGFGRADYFLVAKDFPSYIECQEKVDVAYRDQRRWTKMSILNTAGSSKFSSDRTIHEYAKDIWNIQPLELI
ncbi:alpha-1 4 glucan phosphorylase l-1 isozyme chloroplastic/amyloplastic [Phtheirospermum japonicum]|uniref:Alpha-1,4 glucan phosphorylase n=1 Tax=Phtheirospermum japonicum TaxID=374723 RepID=A0A830D4W5_9LAMI|nr:alpha-1 4 glucan phosphorylase l-1 isozyme chloroplastic/amyloplastic [Phtheirospermum japonicum]